MHTIIYMFILQLNQLEQLNLGIILCNQQLQTFHFSIIH